MKGGTRELNAMKSDRSRGGRMRHRILTAVVLAVGLGVLLGATTVSAKQIQPYEYVSSFNGADSAAGPMTDQVSSIAIDQSNGNLFVADLTDCSGSGTKIDTISQFNSAGQAVIFPAREASSFCARE